MAQIAILKFKEVVDGLIDFVKADYEDKVTKQIPEESFINRILDEDDKIDEISYRNLAIDIFVGRGKKDSRRIDTRLMFDVDRASLPTIHFREPSKQKGKHDGIGGYGLDYLENHLYNDSNELELDGYANIRQRSFDSNLEMMITSVNRHEVMVMEEIIVGLMVGAMDTLSNLFVNFEFSTKELIANNELIPNPLFIKSINLRVLTNKEYPNLTNNEILNKILFNRVA